ncbi:type IIL restriction-modification enzyme MmeI [Corynebacterium sp. YSMAA1_1_D6]|uniref:type IIL restriction-modification enzyme MmeI n=2 Tax=Corynebacterium TaxID=1716 RepID=UPI0030B7FEB4
MENGRLMYPHYSFVHFSEYIGSYHCGPALCELDEKAQQRIIDAGQLVLRARERHPERSLEDHYNPLSKDPILLKAHDELDRGVDNASVRHENSPMSASARSYCSPAAGSWRGAMPPRFHQNQNHQQGRSPCG